MRIWPRRSVQNDSRIESGNVEFSVRYNLLRFGHGGLAALAAVKLPAARGWGSGGADLAQALTGHGAELPGRLIWRGG